MAFPASSYDVLIIGGGPAGSYTASCLAAAGRHVGVFEEHPEIGYPAHCTGLVALETFTRFPLPAPNPIAAFAGALLHSPEGQRLPVTSSQPEALLLDRPAFDRALAAHARATGADLFTGYRVDTVERQRERMRERITGENGPRLVAGRLIILATGASYRLHRGLGLPVPQRVCPRRPGRGRVRRVPRPAGPRQLSPTCSCRFPRTRHPLPACQLSSPVPDMMIFNSVTS